MGLLESQWEKNGMEWLGPWTPVRAGRWIVIDNQLISYLALPFLGAQDCGTIRRNMQLQYLSLLLVS